jgi:benzoyl-CoA reductase/2-hydroxyglutaryl-CoA dehydratase subunit BcrC/BadD/HgdB
MSSSTGGSTLEEHAQEKVFWMKLEKEENKLPQKKEKIAWICSYTPVEIISACGLYPYRFPGREGTSFSADSYLHSNLCFFARCSLEMVLKEAGEGKGLLAGMVLMNSCISMLHFYHALEKLGRLPFVYLLDLPRDDSVEARDYYAVILRGFHRALSEYCGCENIESELWKQIYLYQENRGKLQELYAGRDGEVAVNGDEILRLIKAFTVLSPEKFSDFFKIYRENILGKKKSNLSGPRLFITGGIFPEGLGRLICELGGVLVLDDLCIGRRMLQFPPVEDSKVEADPYRYLARIYLGKDPCPRMPRAYEKLEEMEKMLKRYHIDGVIFYYPKFCDPWYYYGQLLKEKLNNIPLLVLEGENAGITGQMHTRISAFLEMLG